MTPTLTATDNGAEFRCVVTNSGGSATSNAALLSVVSGSPATQPFRTVIVDANNPRNPHCKALGDIDGDGFADILAASSSNYTEGLFWYKYPSWTKVNIHTGSFSTSMALGDVDNDGDLDAVIPKGADYGSSVWWYENPRPSGNPATATWREHSIGNAPAHDVMVLDANKDGRLDVVVRLANSTTLFTQNSPDSWTAKIISSRSYEGLASGDIDNDGDLDIALGAYWIENPLPAANPVTATWTEHLIVAGWSDKLSVALADLDNNGRLDVLLAKSEEDGGPICWFSTSSPRTGPWIQHAIDSGKGYVHTLETGDVNRDGLTDILVGEMHQSSDPDEVVVYTNVGSGARWITSRISSTGTHNAQIGDVDNDGDPDLIGANWNDSAPNSAVIEMWENLAGYPVQSLDAWQRHVVEAAKPYQTIFITAGDIDADGRKDIITGAWWYKQPVPPDTVWSRRTVGSPMNQLACVYDFNGDGTLDVLGTQGIGSSYNTSFAWGRNNGDGTFTILTNIQSGSGTFLQGVAVRRFQGPLEVALSWNHTTNGVQMLTVPSNPSTGTWSWRIANSSSVGQGLDGGDIDRDGDIDIAAGTLWLRNDNTSWSTFTLHPSGGLPDRVRLADMNRDGRLDVVVGYEVISAAGKFTWYEQPAEPTSTWTEHIITSELIGPMSVDVADLDADGDIDIAVGEHNLANSASARLFVMENLDGVGLSWTQHLVFTGDEHHDGAQLVDIDDDGDLDIISIGWQNPRVLLYENKAVTASAATRAAALLAKAESPSPRLTAPLVFRLAQNYPNPFNPATTIEFEMPGATHATLKVYDILGREVATLVNENLPAGVYAVRFPSELKREAISSGMYIYRLTAGNFRAVKRMMLVK